MACDDCRDRLEEFALDELDGDVRNQVARHLDSCHECNKQLAQIVADLAAFAHTLPELAPPQRVERDLFRRINAQSTRRAAGESPVVTTPPTQDPTSALSHGLIAAAVALAACLAGLAVWSSWHNRTTGVGPDEWVELERRVHEAELNQQFNAAPQLNFASLRGPAPEKPVHGYVVTDRVMNQWHIYVFNLPALPEGRVYQLWFTTGSDPPIPATTVEADADGTISTVVDVPSNLTMVSGLAISDEPTSGSQSPSGEHIYQANLP